MHHPILTCTEAIELEHALLGGDTELEWMAMNKAGTALAHQILLDFNELRPFPRDPSILVLAGKGHNAGDALLAAHQLLKARPRGQVCIAAIQDPEQFKPNTRRAYDAITNEAKCKRIEPDAVGEFDFDISLDGLFGMQFHPPLRDPYNQLIAQLNRSDNIGFRAAVDLPSGLSDTRGDEPLRADFTYATGIAKTPLFVPESLQWTGRIRYLDIGFFDAEVPDKNKSWGLLTDATLHPLRKLRHPDCDKRSHGHLLILGGSRTLPGALLMCVRAALRSGVGLVTAFAPESIAAQFAAAAPEAIWVPWPETPDGGLSLEGQYLIQEHIPRASALAVGPGLGNERETQAMLQVVLKKVECPSVLDADALLPEVVSSLHCPTVITPHLGEMARLTGLKAVEIDHATAREHATLFGRSHDFDYTVLLKGPMTHVTNGSQVLTSTYGSPVLARGGSGDLLTGLVGGLLAQGHAPMNAACLAAVWHGQAAEHLARNRGTTAATATQLLNYLHEPLRP